MKRIPSIHVTEEILSVLVVKFLSQQGNNRVVIAKDLAEFILKEGRQYTLRHRSILHPDLKIQKITGRIASSPKAIAYEFSKLLSLLRKKQHHRGIKTLTEKDGVQWQFIVEASGLAHEFTRENKLEMRSGFIEYIGIALKIIKPFTLSRFKVAHDKIQQYYQAAREIEQDKNPVITQTIFDIYQQKVFERTGATLHYKELPLEFVNFVRAAAIAHELDIHGTHFVKAQFDQLDFTNGYPTPSQLSSFKARERALRWMTENNIRANKKNKVLNERQKKFLSKFIVE